MANDAADKKKVKDGESMYVYAEGRKLGADLWQHVIWGPLVPSSFSNIREIQVPFTTVIQRTIV